MMYRLSLSLLLALNCNLLTAMDAQAAQMFAQFSEMMGPFKEMLQLAKEKVKKEDLDEVDADSLNKYGEMMKLNLKRQLLQTVQAYKAYLAQPKDNNSYITNVEQLKKSTDELFATYLSRPTRARVYLAHPQTFEFSETLDKAKGIVDTVEEASAKGDVFDNLLLRDLLLSPHINGLQKMLAAVKEQSKVK